MLTVFQSEQSSVDWQQGGWEASSQQVGFRTARKLIEVVIDLNFSSVFSIADLDIDEEGLGGILDCGEGGSLSTAFGVSIAQEEVNGTVDACVVNSDDYAHKY